MYTVHTYWHLVMINFQFYILMNDEEDYLFITKSIISHKVNIWYVHGCQKPANEWV